MTNEFSIQWEIVREAIHLAYDYNINNCPTQWDYISNLTTEDLNFLLDFYRLQKYTKRINTETTLSWQELQKLIELELNYRDINIV